MLNIKLTFSDIVNISKTNGPIFKFFVLNESWRQPGPLASNMLRSMSFKPEHDLR
jgi:hypothetical protein